VPPGRLRTAVGPARLPAGNPDDATGR